MLRKLLLGSSAASIAAGAIIAGSFTAPPAYAHFTPEPCDFITSGGFIFTDAGSMGNFGAHGGCKNGDFWGHVNYVDHNMRLHVNSTEITGYLIDPAFPNARDICGFARIQIRGKNQGIMRFRVRLEDNGEPGRDDRFGINVANSYIVTARSLGGGGDANGGGNVQLHLPNPSTTGPVSPLTESIMCGDLVTPE